MATQGEVGLRAHATDTFLWTVAFIEMVRRGSTVRVRRRTRSALGGPALSGAASSDIPEHWGRATVGSRLFVSECAWNLFYTRVHERLHEDEAEDSGQESGAKVRHACKDGGSFFPERRLAASRSWGPGRGEGTSHLAGSTGGKAEVPVGKAQGNSDPVVLGKGLRPLVRSEAEHPLK